MIEELQNTSATPVAVVRLENIWSYDHFADALLAHFTLLKRKNPRFTLNAWAKKLGEKNSGNLVHYFKKRRAPTPDMCEKLIQSMHLDEKEADYFRLLVARARYQNSPAGVDYQNRVTAFRLQHHEREMDLQKFEAVSSPLHFAVREILFLSGSDTTPEGIQRRLRVPVSLEQIQHALNDLLDAGLITKTETGEYRKVGGFWQTPGDSESPTIHLYHQRSLHDYIDALRSVPVHQRHFTSYMFSIPSHLVPEAKKCIEEFMNSFVARYAINNGPGDEVYQIHTLFSPWTNINNATRSA